MKTKALVLIFGVVICLVTVFSFSPNTASDGDPWIVPAKYEKMKNPVASDSESIKLGKKLYSRHCKSCHGSEGLGDGSKAAQLDTPCGDFTTKEFQSQTDGSIFYKTIEGRDDMPGFRKKIPEDDDIWSIVNFMRTMK